MPLKYDYLKSKKIAAIVSYVTIIFSTFSNLILTPLYLRHLGQETYGLYQMVYSVANYILILDFGITTTMVRFISEYRIKKQQSEEENFAAHCLSILVLLVFFVIITGFTLNGFILSIFPSITKDEENLAHSMFIVMFFTIALTLIEHYFTGIVMAYEHFTVTKVLGLVKIVLKLGLTILFLSMKVGVLSIVYSDIIIVALVLLFLLVYSFVVLKFKVHLYGWSGQIVITIVTFMFAIFLQSIVSYVNNTVDKTLLGMLLNKKDVAVYSVAMTFISLFNSLPWTITNMFLPEANRLVAKNADRTELTLFVVRPGRYQFMLCGGILSGFLLFGKEFIQLWVGSDLEAAWLVALIIMAPSMIYLISSVTVPILDAKKKRLFRSIVMLLLSIVNVIITIFLVKKVGMIGAPIGTGISYLVGYGIVLNVYYDRVINIDMIKMYKLIFSKTWVCLLGVSLISIPLNIFIKQSSWVIFGFKAIVFSVVFFLLMLVYGFNQNEKKDVMQIIAKVKK